MGALAGAIRHELVIVPSVGLEAVGPRAQLKALKAGEVGWAGGLQAKFLDMFLGETESCVGLKSSSHFLSWRFSVH